MYWWIVIDSMDNFDWDDYRHQVMQVAIIWAKTHKQATKIAGKWGFEVFHGMLDSGGRYKTVPDALKGWKDNQRGNKPHRYNEIDFAVKNGKMYKVKDIMNESYKVHYPSLKNLTQLQYTDPRVNTEGRTIHAEREGNFCRGDESIHGHYVVYEDKKMPGTYIGVHIGSELSEDGGDAPINVVAMDKSRSAVVNRVSYRARRGKVSEGEEQVVEETDVEKLQRIAGIHEDQRDIDRKASSYYNVKGKGNAVASHKKALADAIKKHKGKAKEQNPLYHVVSGGPHGTYHVRTDDDGGKIITHVVFNENKYDKSGKKRA